MTAEAGVTEITLKHAVSWQIGDTIVIATTGDHLSQKESETREITGKLYKFDITCFDTMYVMYKIDLDNED